LRVWTASPHLPATYRRQEFVVDKYNVDTHQSGANRQMGSYLLVRLTEEDKADLFIFAKQHRTTASEIVRQFIRGMVRPELPHLISNRVVDPENVTASPGRQP
jgi:hypothetical protein